MKRESYVEQKAELRIYDGDTAENLDPDELTNLLGITPTKVWRRGDLLRSGRVRDSTVWWWETDDRVERDSELMVLQVLERFEPAAQQLAEAKSRWGITLEVGLVVTMYGGATVDQDGTAGLIVATPAMAFSAETLGRLARLGASFDADQYVDEIPSD